VKEKGTIPKTKAELLVPKSKKSPVALIRTMLESHLLKSVHFEFGKKNAILEKDREQYMESEDDPYPPNHVKIELLDFEIPAACIISSSEGINCFRVCYFATNDFLKHKRGSQWNQTWELCNDKNLDPKLRYKLVKLVREKLDKQLFM
jgi:hypothetical protein